MSDAAEVALKTAFEAMGLQDPISFPETVESRQSHTWEHTRAKEVPPTVESTDAVPRSSDVSILDQGRVY